MVSLCHGDWLCQAGQNTLLARGTLLSWDGATWESQRAGSMNRGVKKGGAHGWR